MHFYYSANLWSVIIEHSSNLSPSGFLNLCFKYYPPCPQTLSKFLTSFLKASNFNFDPVFGNLFGSQLPNCYFFFSNLCIWDLTSHFGVAIDISPLLLVLWGLGLILTPLIIIKSKSHCQFQNKEKHLEDEKRRKIQELEWRWGLNWIGLLNYKWKQRGAGSLAL